MTIEYPIWMQAGTSYSARLDRQIIRNIFSEGVLGATSLAVTQRGAGANMSVDVAAGVAIVVGDDETNQGSYLIHSTGVENAVVTAAPGSNSRYDIVVLQVNDVTAGGSAGNNAVVSVIAGTAAASPVVPTVPDSALHLATILVSAGMVSIVDANITDARAFSRMTHDLIATGQVVTAKIPDSGVTTAKIADDAITSAKIAAGAVGSSEIADGAVQTAEIADANVTEAKLATAVLSSSWTDFPLEAGWQAPAGSQRLRYKKVGNVVFLAGQVQRSGATATGSLVGTLPAGFRPGDNVWLSTYPLASTTPVDIGPDGTMYLTSVSQWSSYGVNGVFPADQ